MADCEWMFGDAARGVLGIQCMARWNPLRWSGSKTFEAAARGIQLATKDGDRPIVVKCPSGILSSENKFKTAQEAIDFIESKDPIRWISYEAGKEASVFRETAEQADQQAAEAAAKPIAEDEEELAQEEAWEVNKRETERLAKEAEEAVQRTKTKALGEANASLESQHNYLTACQRSADEAKVRWDAAKEERVQSDLAANWMYGDAGKRLWGKSGVQKFSQANPMRWSGKQDYETTMADMRKVMEDQKRPILMKASVADKETIHHESAEAAMKFLEDKCPKQRAQKQKLREMEMKYNDANKKLATCKQNVLMARQAVVRAAGELEGTKMSPHRLSDTETPS